MDSNFSALTVKFSEGFLTTCSVDFLSDDADTKVFIGSMFAWAYCTPMSIIIYNYWNLLKAVRTHEKMLKEQVSLF